MPLDRKPDAIIAPSGYFAGQPDALTAAKRLFGPLLGTPRVHCSYRLTYNLFTPAAGHHGYELGFPKDGPKANQERYTWHVALRAGNDWALGEAVESHADAPDQLKFGYLRSEASFSTEDAREYRENLAARQAEEAAANNTPAKRRERLDLWLEQGVLTRPEYDEMVAELGL
jgi:hypothetical protein